MRHRASLRLRLTLSYGVLFFVIGFLLLALSYLLLRQVAIKNPGELANHTAQELHLSQAYLQQHITSPTGGRQSVGVFLRQVQDQTISEMLRALIGVTFWALAVATARLGRRRLVDGRAHAAAGQGDLRRGPAPLGQHPARTHQPGGPPGRARAARRHVRRDARPPRDGLQRPAGVRLERLARAAHAAGDHAHRARRHPRRPGDGRRRPAPHGPDDPRRHLAQRGRHRQAARPRGERATSPSASPWTWTARASAPRTAHARQAEARGHQLQRRRPSRRSRSATRRFSSGSWTTSSTTPCATPRRAASCG